MRKFTIFSFILGLCLMLTACNMNEGTANTESISRTDNDNNDTEEAAVLAAYEAIQQAMIDKDIETLDRLYLDGTTFTHMSGKTQTKEEFFGEIADGTLNYYAYDIHDPQITVNGDQAVLMASVTLTAKVYGASGEWTLPVNARYTKIDGEWHSHN